MTGRKNNKKVAITKNGNDLLRIITSDKNTKKSILESIVVIDPKYNIGKYVYNAVHVQLSVDKLKILLDAMGLSNNEKVTVYLGTPYLSYQPHLYTDIIVIEKQEGKVSGFYIGYKRTNI